MSLNYSFLWDYFKLETITFKILCITPFERGFLNIEQFQYLLRILRYGAVEMVDSGRLILDEKSQVPHKGTWHEQRLQTWEG